MSNQYYTYIMGSISLVLYIGVTNNLVRRVYEHKQGFVDGFCKKYKANRLLHYETFTDIRDAIAREKQLKKWKREWKLELIKDKNPELRDLYQELV